MTWTIPTGAWGWLPLAAPAMLFVVSRLGQLAFPFAPGSGCGVRHRIVAGPVLAMALLVVVVRLLGTLHLVNTAGLLVSLAIAVAALAFTGRARPSLHRLRETIARTVHAILTRESLPFLLLACAAVGIAALTARWLPIWHWDSLGYHLPYVNFVLQGRSQEAVPPDIPYLSTYPHNIETYFVALRAMLPDDRLIDLGQIPFGLMGAAVIASIARMFGAESPHAFIAGCAWLLTPVVFLQLPSNYVDVGSAALLLAAVYFVLLPAEPRAILLAGIALGLYLGSKANAPMGTALLGTVLAVKAARAGHWRLVLLAWVVIILFGAESFLENIVRHGNPTWPVKLSLGPLQLSGKITITDVLNTAPALPRAHGPFPLRILRSWTSLSSSHVTFDMRMGGFGPVFLASLPFAICTAVRARRLPLVAALLATLASPDPAWARFVLAFVAMVLALAAPHLARIPSLVKRVRRRQATSRQTVGVHVRFALLALVAAVGLWQLVYAWPGLIGEGPPLFAYASMSEEERLKAVGADGDPTPFVEARKHVRDDETFAFDVSDELPYLGWENNLRYRAVAIPHQLTYEEVSDFFQKEKVRLFIAGDDTPVGRWAKDHPAHAVQLFPCHSVPCSVYERH